MKKSELKNILKPLIRECIKEVILDEGILSGIISEVARGLGGIQAIVTTPTIIEENKDPALGRMKRNAFNKEQSSKLQEHRNKLMSAIGESAYNGVDLFEGTTPAAAQVSPTQPGSPMSGQSPVNAGVDISNLLGTVGHNWDAHMNEVKEGK